MVLVTGAAGKTGRAIIHAISEKNHDIRAFVHRDEQITSVKEAGAQDVIVGEMADQLLLIEATRGVKVVYHICPNISPDELDIGRKIISASQSMGVDRFVYHSVLHPQVEVMPHHWAKMRVEEALFTSRLAYTILQPAAYMQNILAYWSQIIQGQLPIPYGPKTRLALVDLLDVAEVAATIIGDSKYTGAIYELAGPDSYSQEELAQVFSIQLGIRVQVEQISIQAWKETARSIGLGHYQIETLAAMFQYYDKFGFEGNSTVLSYLLGRKPTDLIGFIQRHLRKSS